MSLVSDFSDLFKGNIATFGQWEPSTGKMFTVKDAARDGNFSSHLNGKVGIGIVPIMENGMVWWGAIDIDNHGKNSEVVNLEVIARMIFTKGLPLVPCRSKSGGVHCYLFMSEPVPAVLMQRLLQKWRKDIGFREAEIFPKQTELRDNITGNWINLPYFDGPSTNRYSVEIVDGVMNKLSCAEFVSYAKSCKMTMAMMRSFILTGHEQAPPCLQELIIRGVGKGQRNEVLYGFTIYLKKKYPPAQFRQEVININDVIFETPLALSEINKTIQSASRKEYQYKCIDEPFRGLCDSKTCVNREFGIQKSESVFTGEGVPEFTKLRVMDTEPPVWELTVNTTPLMIDTKTLRNFFLLAEEIMNRLYIVVPIISQKDWMVMLAELIKDVEHIEAPDNASTDGVIRERLLEFINRADFNNAGKDPSDKDLIARGLPVVQEVEGIPGKRVVLFRGQDFISYLKRTRSEELKGTALWLAIRKMGVVHKRTRVNGSMANVWAVPIDGRGRTKLEWNYDGDKLFSPMNKESIKLLNRINF